MYCSVLYYILRYLPDVIIMNTAFAAKLAFSQSFVSWTLNSYFYLKIYTFACFQTWESLKNVLFLFDASSGLRKTLKLSLFSRLTKRLKSESLRSDFTIDLKHEVRHGLFG